jgi:hypothetical protein
MERLDQGHLYPLLEVARLTCPAGNRIRASSVGDEHSSKELFEQLFVKSTELATKPGNTNYKTIHNIALLFGKA